MSVYLDDSHLREDFDMISDYMEEVRDQALQKLTLLEFAALMNDIKEFQIRYNEERIEEYASNQME